MPIQTIAVCDICNETIPPSSGFFVVVPTPEVLTMESDREKFSFAVGVAGQVDVEDYEDALVICSPGCLHVQLARLTDAMMSDYKDSTGL